MRAEWIQTLKDKAEKDIDLNKTTKLLKMNNQPKNHKNQMMLFQKIKALKIKEHLTIFLTRQVTHIRKSKMIRKSFNKSKRK